MAHLLHCDYNSNEWRYRINGFGRGLGCDFRKQESSDHKNNHNFTAFPILNFSSLSIAS